MIEDSRNPIDRRAILTGGLTGVVFAVVFGLPKIALAVSCGDALGGGTFEPDTACGTGSDVTYHEDANCRNLPNSPMGAPQSDTHCGGPTGGGPFPSGVDPDQNCGVNHPGLGVDNDRACGRSYTTVETTTDAHCNQVYGASHIDEDNHCNTPRTGGAAGAVWRDSSCGNKMPGDVSFDSDEDCGHTAAVSGSLHSDTACGKAEQPHLDPDGRCSLRDPDPTVGVWSDGSCGLNGTEDAFQHADAACRPSSSPDGFDEDGNCGSAQAGPPPNDPDDDGDPE